jgi:transcriptional regulator with XRE-family HTH domain
MAWGEETPLPVLPDPDVRKKLRTSMGVTIRAAAAELGVSTTSYSFWESDERTPKPEHLRAYHAQLSRWLEAVENR